MGDQAALTFFRRFVFLLGAGMLTVSMLGKGSIYFYRAIKAGNAFGAAGRVG